MAWQLLYTSAPRSLEAGRSGFGTVARHRAISPLLVSAIERASQFSRLPGADAGRVIFSYRIIAVAGGRFHVLSAIRDAGADYTGRTNHIAHHLIADPREIAQLGAAGPSPADVLLAMPWATSWSEAPRYLEAEDEIALAAIRPQRSGSAWAQITGHANHAWLLASGDASRGAYVIQPGGTDLRAIFAESLGLIPERLWQIAFTTSLQPSDEPADFRWIGIEERSPLRAQTEASGRPTLNLAAPETLPLVQVPPPARQTAAQIPAPTAPDSAPPAARLRRAEPWAAEPKGGRKTKWWLAGAGLLAVAVALAIARPLYLTTTHDQHRAAVEGEIGSIMGVAVFLPENVTRELKVAKAIDLAKELAVEGITLEKVAKAADFDAMKVRRPGDDLRQRTRAATPPLPVPREIAQLDQRLGELAVLHQELSAFHPQPDDYTALARLEKWRVEAEQLTNEPPKSDIFGKIRSELARLADQQVSHALRILITGPDSGQAQPAEKRAWFHQQAKAREAGDADLKAVRQVIKDWEFVDDQKPDKVLTELEQRLETGRDWPGWLKAQAQAKIAAARGGKSEPMPHAPPSPPDKPAATGRVPLYFANGRDGLPNCRIEELGPNLKYFLKPGLNEKPIELTDLNKNGTLRRSVAGDSDFEIKEAQKQIALAKGAASLPLPFALSAQDATGREVFQLWVVSASAEPLFGTRNTGLTNDGTKLSIAPASAPLPGEPRANLYSLYLETPADFLPALLPRAKTNVYKLDGLGFSLKETLEAIQVRRKEAVAARDKVKAPTEQSLFDDSMAEAHTYLSKSAATHLTTAPASSHRKLCGAMLLAFGEDWKQLGFEKPFPEARDVSDWGAILVTDQLDKKPVEAEKALKRALEFVRTITRNDKLSGPDKAKIGKLKALEDMLVLAGGDPDVAKTLLVERTQASDKRRTELEDRIRNIDALALLNHGLPGGKYRLLVGLSSSEAVGAGAETRIPLWDFILESPPPPKP